MGHARACIDAYARKRESSISGISGCPLDARANDKRSMVNCRILEKSCVLFSREHKDQVL